MQAKIATNPAFRRDKCTNEYFVVYDKIILEAKAVAGIAEEFIALAINYLKVSGNKLALLVNFGEPKLNYKRIVL